jgi:hypothetical protein
MGGGHFSLGPQLKRAQNKKAVKELYFVLSCAMRGFPGFSGFPPSPETNRFTLSLSDMGRMMAFSVAIANYRLGHVSASPFVIQN